MVKEDVLLAIVDDSGARDGSGHHQNGSENGSFVVHCHLGADFDGFLIAVLFPVIVR